MGRKGQRKLGGKEEGERGRMEMRIEKKRWRIR
jgi:hypothetical protein